MARFLSDSSALADGAGEGKGDASAPLGPDFADRSR